MVQSRTRGLADDAGTQIADLKDAIAELTSRISDITASRTRDARKQARSAAKSVRASGGQLYDEGSEALSAAGDAAVYYGRRAGSVVRQNPGLSTLGILVGVGVVAAIIYAAQEDEKRWYDRPRGGWF